MNWHLGNVLILKKSMVNFSPNVGDEELKGNILNFLGLSSTETRDCYLGLPSFVGRDKRRTFNGIRERVWRKLQMWRGNLVSIGG